MNELKDASDMMDLYKCRIEHLNKVVSDGEQEKKTEAAVQDTKTEVLSVQVACDLMSVEEWEEN